MPRIRSIKPEYFNSLSISGDTGLSFVARLTFVGLWTHADDGGRFLDEPRLIKAALFAMDDDMPSAAVATVVDELVTKGRLVRYEADDVKLLQVVGWEHQKIDRRSPSKWPAPPGFNPDGSPFDDDSTNPRRAFVEGSSPDHGSLDRITGAGAAGASTPANTTKAAPPARSAAAAAADIVDQALDELLVLRDTNRISKTKDNPPRWLKAAMTGIREEITDLLTREPRLTTAEVVERLEPTAPPRTRPRLPGIDHSTDACPCDGHGWIHHDDGVAACTGPAKKAS
jgi:hypothetical protein